MAKAMGADEVINVSDNPLPADVELVLEAARMLVYELLGGAAGEGVMVYGHASGTTLEDLGADFQHTSWGVRITTQVIPRSSPHRQTRFC